MSVPPNDLRDQALRLAGWGWYVFPLRPRGKEPVIPKKEGGNGYHDATVDPAQIEVWWAKYPNANIGVATGKSGLTVLDVDGPEGQALLRSVSAGDVPATLAAATGREGGLHLYYRGGTVPQSQKKGEKLDLRSASGYVVAPPSIHRTDRKYAWINQLPCAIEPAWVASWVASRHGMAPTMPTAPRERPSYVGVGTPQAPRLLAQRALAAFQVPWSQHEEVRLRSALAAIPANIDGRTWYSYLGALHSLRWIINGVDVGFEIADWWSSLSPPNGRGEGLGLYRGRANIEKRWAGFDKEYNGPRTTVASIYQHAVELGWDFSKTVNGSYTNGLHVSPEVAPQAFNLGPLQQPIIFPDVDQKGRPRATCTNTRIALQQLGVCCEYDTFHERMIVGGQQLGEWAGELSDNTVQMIRVEVHKRFQFDPGLQAAHDAAVQECLLASFDPVQDYLDDLVWDGRARLDTWMADYLGAELTPFNCAVGRLALVAAVRRARRPGIKFDQIIVLEGPEGRGKSSAIELLAGTANFSDQSILTLDDKAQQEALQGVWIYEIADLAGHSRAEVERVKAFASRTVDRARPAYGRSRVDRPRRCVFFATTNSDTYLKSQTGNRRFWPVRCGRVNLDALTIDRNQLWAEAVSAEPSAKIMLPEVLWDDATIEQDNRRDHDPWDDALAYVTAQKYNRADGSGLLEYRMPTKDLLDVWLKIPGDRQNDAAVKRLSYVMRRLGWEGPKTFRMYKTLHRGYTRPVVMGESPQQGESQEPVKD